MSPERPTAAGLERLLEGYATSDAGGDIKTARWPLIAAVSLVACSGGADLLTLYRFLTKELPLEDRKLVQRRIKEAILKTTMLYGTPKALAALLPLYDSMPEEEIDNFSPRYDETQSTTARSAAREERGWKFFETLWTPASAQSIREVYMKHHKDMFVTWVKNVVDVVVSEDAILDLIETELCMTAALICSQNPVQAVWHSKGLVRQGGSLDDVRLTHGIAKDMAAVYGCDVRDLPSVEAIDFGAVSVH